MPNLPPSGKSAKVEGRDKKDEDSLSPMRRFRALAQRLSNVSQEELKERERRYEEKRRATAKST